MIALLQRVDRAQVTVGKITVGAIKAGVLVFLAIEKNDSESAIERMLERVLGYRIFADANGKMNLNLQDIHGELLIVPQFTLAANTQKGMRASFTCAAPPELGKEIFIKFVELARQHYPKVASGEFGADMKVELVNDGPVTFWLQVKPG